MVLPANSNPFLKEECVTHMLLALTAISDRGENLLNKSWHLLFS